MSEASDDIVLVDHDSVGEGQEFGPPSLVPEEDFGGRNRRRPPPQAVQIVTIEGLEGHHRFAFRRDLLDSILDDIPKDYRVSVVSVVGAFRTGKSFLLSWFLRYLFRSGSSKGKIDNKKKEEEEGGTASSHPAWYRQFSSLGNDGFEWKAGSERNTTGIWMWSEAHLNSQAKVATLLVDTQGMFDHETTMNLTASIFGFSTLFSSYLIYNVDKRIQEDHLQQLALFSEYARAAVGSSDRSSGGGSASSSSLSPGVDADAEDDEPRKTSDAAGSSVAEAAPAPAPFQHVEFLVRDWQHYEVGDDDAALDGVDYEALERSMADYLTKVLQERNAKDLQETREQIHTCFDQVTCYGLCHPGFEVTKKRYGGDVSALEPLFLRLLDRYCRRVFESAAAQPKTIHGRTLTVAELGSYVQVYATLFAEGDKKFPTVATLLAATSQANNTNAVQLALSDYKIAMDRSAGPRCSSFLKKEELMQEHQRAVEMSLERFDSIATFGSRSSIGEARETLVKTLLERYEVYTSLNEGRNPLKGLETYVLSMAQERLCYLLQFPFYKHLTRALPCRIIFPVLIGVVSYLIRWFTDMACTATVCQATSNFFGHASQVVFSFLAILAATRFQQILVYVHRLRAALGVALPPPQDDGRRRSSGPYARATSDAPPSSKLKQG
jgi:atlastin